MAQDAHHVAAARLLEAGRSLVAELDLEVVLERLLETARELTGARYAAIGVLDERRRRSSASSPAASIRPRMRRSATCRGARRSSAC